MLNVLALVGAVLFLIGLVMIPLPGPGYLVLTPGAAILLGVGVAWFLDRRRASRSEEG